MNRSVTKQGSLLVSAVFVLVVCSITAPAQTTSFTYQGRLTDGGAPANGTYDLEFKLYDALMNGNLPGTPNTVSRPGVLVTNGGFTVQLDGNEVTRIRASTGAVEGSPIVTGSGPWALAFDGTFIYVANEIGGSVTRF